MTKTKEVSATKTLGTYDEQLRKLVEDIDGGWYELAKLAHEVRTAEVFPTKEELVDYLEKDLNDKITYRVFMYHAHIGRVVESFGLEKERIASIGWAKFKELARLFEAGITKEEIETLLDLVKGMTTKEVIEFVKAKLGKTGKAKKTKITFELSEEDLAIANEAVTTALEQNHLEDSGSPSMGFMLIVAQYLSSYRADGSKVVPSFQRKITEG